MSWPFSSTAPESGRSSATTTRPMVVFPQPDSPTRPNVFPAATVNETLETACTAATLRCRIAPAVTGNSLTRSRTSSRGGTRSPHRRLAVRPGQARGHLRDSRGTPSRGLGGPVDRVPAREQVVRAFPGQRGLLVTALAGWPGCTAARTGSSSSRAAPAPVAAAGMWKQLPGGRPGQPRSGGHQAPGVGVTHVAEEVRRPGHLGHAARVHYLDPVRVPGDHAHVVGDQQHRDAEAVLVIVHQREDLRLDGDVQCRRRLVGDQQLRLTTQRHRDHHPLAHAAGKLVRIVAEPLVGPGNPDHAEHFGGTALAAAWLAPCAAGPFRRSGGRPSWWGRASASGPGRSSRCRCRASRGARPRPARPVPCRRNSSAADYLPARRHQPHDRQPRDRFPHPVSPTSPSASPGSMDRSTLPTACTTDLVSWMCIDRSLTWRTGGIRATPGRRPGGRIVWHEKGGHRRRSLTSSASRSASPSRLQAITTTMMQIPTG